MIVFYFTIPNLLLQVSSHTDPRLTYEQLNCTNQDERFLRVIPKWAPDMVKIGFDMRQKWFLLQNDLCKITFMCLPCTRTQGLRMNRLEDVSKESIIVRTTAAFSGKGYVLRVWKQ